MNTLLDLLSTAGTVLDTPSSVVRGLLAGDPGRAFGGVFDPERRVSGAELLGNDPNASLFSGQGLANMGTEMALDPLNALGGLGLLKTLRSAKAIKANNALLPGGMPADIAKLTKVVDESGNPLKTYHGTHAVYDHPDPKLGYVKDQDYGPGFYAATSGEDASDFLLKKKGANVRQQYLDIRSPFYADQALKPDEADALLKRFMGDTPAPEPSFMQRAALPPDEYGTLRSVSYGDIGPGYVNGKDVISRLEQSLGAEGAVNAMKGQGYDGVFGAHLVNENPGYDFMQASRMPASAHKQIVAFDADQIYAPWTRPTQQRVPSTSPLLAALGGYNAVRAQN